jgi:hypothetical protein
MEWPHPLSAKYLTNRVDVNAESVKTTSTIEIRMADYETQLFGWWSYLIEYCVPGLCPESCVKESGADGYGGVHLDD